eukprot:g1220.t1
MKLVLLLGLASAATAAKLVLQNAHKNHPRAEIEWICNPRADGPDGCDLHIPEHTKPLHEVVYHVGKLEERMQTVEVKLGDLHELVHQTVVPKQDEDHIAIGQLRQEYNDYVEAQEFEDHNQIDINKEVVELDKDLQRTPLAHHAFTCAFGTVDQDTRTCTCHTRDDGNNRFSAGSWSNPSAWAAEARHCDHGEGQYEAAAPSAVSDRSCVSQCTATEHEAPAPTRTTGRACTALARCADTQWQTRAPTVTTSRKVLPRSSPPSGDEGGVRWSSAAGAVLVALLAAAVVLVLRRAVGAPRSSLIENKVREIEEQRLPALARKTARLKKQAARVKQQQQLQQAQAEDKKRVRRVECDSGVAAINTLLLLRLYPFEVPDNFLEEHLAGVRSRVEDKSRLESAFRVLETRACGEGLKFKDKRGGSALDRSDGLTVHMAHCLSAYSKAHGAEIGDLSDDQLDAALDGAADDWYAQRGEEKRRQQTELAEQEQKGGQQRLRLDRLGKLQKRLKKQKKRLKKRRAELIKKLEEPEELNVEACVALESSALPGKPQPRGVFVLAARRARACARELRSPTSRPPGHSRRKAAATRPALLRRGGGRRWAQLAVCAAVLFVCISSAATGHVGAASGGAPTAGAGLLEGAVENGARLLQAAAAPGVAALAGRPAAAVLPPLARGPPERDHHRRLAACAAGQYRGQVSVRRTSGSCSEPLSSQAACTAAFAELGLGAAQTVNPHHGLPPGCIAYYGSGPYFNPAVNSPKTCDGVFQCVCRETTCIDCAPGRYTDQAGQEVCAGAMCAAGRFGPANQTSAAAATCADCAVGAYAPTGSSACAECVGGNVTEHAGERGALLALLNSTGGAASWTRSGGWGSASAHICCWYGVTCDAVTGRVIKIALNRNKLAGVLPAELGTALVALASLYLQDNELTGALPAEWKAMTAVTTIWLFRNKLSGSLPAEWKAMTALNDLRAFDNQFSGSLPAEWKALTAVTTIQLFRNKLSGSLPAEWKAMTALNDLRAFDNHFSGLLPAEWKALTAVTNVNFRSNLLTGSLPAEWKAMTAVTEMYLHTNKLTGSLPAEWQAMTAVTTMHLYNNELTGSLPAAWKVMTAVKQMVLYNNELTGSLPAEWQAMTAVTTMYLYNNELTGSLPAEWQAMTAVTQIGLHANKLIGSLPAEWQAMKAVTQIGLNANKLNGSLPAAWKAMTAVTEMYLNANKLTGSLPAAWKAMTAVTTISLRYNKLSGSLPVEWKAMTAVREMYLHVNKLTGSLPAAWKAMTAVRQMIINANELTGSLPAEWQAMTAVTTIGLHANKLTGSLPAAWKAMTAVFYIDLTTNKLSGSLPAAWHAMTAVTNMWLHTNKLSGSLPAEWQAMTAVNHMVLYNNELSGPLPAEWKALTRVTNLRLDNNRLTGSPGGATLNALLPSLQMLDLSNNSFAGFPADLGVTPAGAAVNTTATGDLVIKLARNPCSWLPPWEWVDAVPLMGHSRQRDGKGHSRPKRKEHAIATAAHEKRTSQYMRSLRAIDLSWMRVSATPQRVLQPLASLERLGSVDVSHNNITGDVSAPYDVFVTEYDGYDPSSDYAFVRLVSLQLQDNPGLAGPLPQAIGPSHGTLLLLNIENCAFSGRIPETTTYQSLRVLAAAGNAALRAADARLPSFMAPDGAQWQDVLLGRRQCAAVQGKGASVDGTFTLDPTYTDHSLAHGVCRCGAGLELELARGEGGPGAASCALCAPGQFKVAGVGGCAACPAGKYNERPGNTLCLDCPPFSTTLRRGTAGKAGCACVAEHFRCPAVRAPGADCGDAALSAADRAAKHDGACIACSAFAVGANCSAPGATLATLTSGRGFWRATNATAVFRACNPLRPGECRGGAIPPNGTRDAQCAKGHAGPKCEACDRDHDPPYVRKFGGVCGTCAPGEGVGVMLVAPTAVLLLMVVALFLQRYHADKLRGLNGWVTKRTIKTRILFGFIATVTRTPLVYGLQMPSVVAHFYQALGFLELFDLSGFVSNAACLLRSDYTTKVYVQTGLALGVFALLGAAYARARCHAARASSRHKQRTAGGGIANGALFFAFLIFAPLMTTLLLAYGCTRYEDGRSYLAADLSIDCTDAHYRAMLEWAGFCVAVFVAGIPLVYFVLLYRHRAALQPEPRTADERQEARVLGFDAWSHLMRADDPNIQHLSFLWSGYTPGCWWFEVFEMARKFLITGVPILLTLAVGDGDESSGITMAYGLVVTGLTTMVHALGDPYLSTTDRSLLLLTQLTVFIGLVGGMVASYYNNNVERVQVGVTWFVLSTSAPIALLNLYAFWRPDAADRLLARRNKQQVESVLDASEAAAGPSFARDRVQPVISGLVEDARLKGAAQDPQVFVLALARALLRAALVHEAIKGKGGGKSASHNTMEAAELEALDVSIQAYADTKAVVAALGAAGLRRRASKQQLRTEEPMPSKNLGDELDRIERAGAGAGVGASAGVPAAAAPGNEEQPVAVVAAAAGDEKQLAVTCAVAADV